MTQYPYVAAPATQAPTHGQQGYPQPGHSPTPYSTTLLVPGTNHYLELGKLGAVVGLCGAAAVNLRRMQANEATGAEALLDTVRTGVAAGLATATAGFVANQFRGSIASTVATLATGTAVMYVLNTEAPHKPAKKP